MASNGKRSCLQLDGSEWMKLCSITRQLQDEKWRVEIPWSPLTEQHYKHGFQYLGSIILRSPSCHHLLMHCYSFPESDPADEIISDREQPSAPSPMKSHKLPGICHVFNISMWTRQGRLKSGGDFAALLHQTLCGQCHCPSSWTNWWHRERQKIEMEGGQEKKNSNVPCETYPLSSWIILIFRLLYYNCWKAPSLSTIKCFIQGTIWLHQSFKHMFGTDWKWKA